MDKRPVEREAAVSNEEDIENHIVVYRTADGELTLRDGSVVIDDPEVIDMLLASRDQPLIANEIHKTGVRLGQETVQRIGALAAKLHEMFEGEDIVQAETLNGSRKTMQYALTAALRVIDQRERYAEVKYNPIERIRRQVEHMQAYQPETRLSVFSGLFKEYKNNRRLYKKLTELYAENVLPNIGRLDDFTVLGEPPSAEESKKYLLELEIGIVTFFEGRDTAVIEEAALRMIEAYYSLFYRHHCLIAESAIRFRHNLTEYQELCHEGKVALFQLISDYLSYKTTIVDQEEFGDNNDSTSRPSRFLNDESTFTDQARLVIKQAMRQFSWFESKKVTPKKIAEHRKAIEELRARYSHALTFRQIGAQLGLREHEVVEALFDGRRPRNEPPPAETEQRESIDVSMEQFTFQDDIAELLKRDNLTDREKIVISLHYGIFIDSLRGAEFMPKSSFIYPQSEEGMPAGPLNTRELGEILGVRFDTVRAMLHVGLKACKDHLQSQGFESFDDLLM